MSKIHMLHKHIVRFRSSVRMLQVVVRWSRTTHHGRDKCHCPPIFLLLPAPGTDLLRCCESQHTKIWLQDWCAQGTDGAWKILSSCCLPAQDDTSRAVLRTAATVPAATSDPYALTLQPSYIKTVQSTHFTRVTFKCKVLTAASSSKRKRWVRQILTLHDNQKLEQAQYHRCQLGNKAAGWILCKWLCCTSSLYLFSSSYSSLENLQYFVEHQ